MLKNNSCKSLGSVLIFSLQKQMMLIGGQKAVSDQNRSEYYLVSANALPEIFIKVAKAKERLQTGESQTVAEAV